MRRPSARQVAVAVNLLVVALACAFVLAQLQPHLLVADTTPAGGDMGAHVWQPAYLLHHLLPKGRITGWAPDWYAGFPSLVFYFPAPSVLIALLSLVAPYGVAFKLVTVLGLVSLPVCVAVFARLAGLRRPAPACMAVASIGFLFERSFTIYGGNIASTLAGEFSFSISLSLGFLFLGLLARALDTGRHRALAAVLLSLTVLCHILPTIFVGVAAAVLVLLRPSVRRLAVGTVVGAVGAAVASFWLIPFYARLPYTNDMGWEKDTHFPRDLYHPVDYNNVAHDLRWLLALAAVGAVISVVRNRRAGIVLTVAGLLAALAFRLMPGPTPAHPDAGGKLWNARMLPFWYLCLYLLAGLAVGELAHGVAWLLARAGSPSEWARRAPSMVVPVLALAVMLYVTALPLGVLDDWGIPHPASTDRSYVASWARWNYSGYEGVGVDQKARRDEYFDVVDTMAAVGRDQGCGRALWEYEPELDSMGTPMALMLLPYWTNGCIGSEEGLYFESSATTPYHFLLSAQTSARPSNPQRRLPYGSLDVAKAVPLMQLMGIRYYMALTTEAQQQASADPRLRLVAQSQAHAVSYPSGTGSQTQNRTWNVYEVAGSELVQGLAQQPAVVQGLNPRSAKDWQQLAVDWFTDEAHRQVPLAASGPSSWARVAKGDATPPAQALPPVVVSNIRTGDDNVRFDVDRPGVPVLVKVSYFPNWRASGADGPWRVTPNLMVVVPTSTHVRLHYASTPVDALGMGVSAGGLLAATGLALLPAAVLERRRRRVRHVQPQDVAVTSPPRDQPASPVGPQPDPDQEPVRPPVPVGSASEPVAAGPGPPASGGSA